MRLLSDEIRKIKEENKEQKDKKLKSRDERQDSNKTIEENKKQIEYNRKASQELMKLANERLTELHKKRKFEMMDVQHLASKFEEEREALKKTQESEYEEFLGILRANKPGVMLTIALNLSLTFVLMFGTEKPKKKQFLKIEKEGPRIFLQKYSYQRFLEDLAGFNLQKQLLEDYMHKLELLHTQAIQLNQQYGKTMQKFMRVGISWFINAINYLIVHGSHDKDSQLREREFMEAEDMRSKSINLLAINQQRQEEIKILDSFSKKLEKKIRKINTNISSLKEIGTQLKDIKKDLSLYVKKWKAKVVDQPPPFEMTEGNMLFIALYFVFIMKFPSIVSSYLRDYILNLMLEWDLKLSVSSKDAMMFEYINYLDAAKDFSEECSLFGIEENRKVYENLALIKLIKKFKLPFPFIYDPLGIAFKYIQNLEQSKGVEVEMMTIIEAEDLDQDNVMSPENKIFEYYQDRQLRNETTFEKLVRCMENGIPVIIKDADVKTFKLIDSLIQWRFKNYQREVRDKYYNKTYGNFDVGMNYDSREDERSNINQDDSISDKESNRSRGVSGFGHTGGLATDDYLGYKNVNQNVNTGQNSNTNQTQNTNFNINNNANFNFDYHRAGKDDDNEIDTIHFNKAFVTIKRSFRLYMIFSSKEFQNIENYYRQRTTFINLAIEEDEEQMKDIILDVLMQQFQFEPYLITYLLKGHNYRIQNEQLKKERMFFKYFRIGSGSLLSQQNKESEKDKQEKKDSVIFGANASNFGGGSGADLSQGGTLGATINFRSQQTINEIKAMIKSLKDIQHERIKFVLENKYLKKYRALFEKVQKQMDEEELNEANLLKENSKSQTRPGTGESHIPPQQQAQLYGKKKQKNVHRNQSFDQDNLLQFYLKSPSSQNQNKEAFDKLYHEILDSNNKQKTSFRQKILFATEPVYILWKTTQDVRKTIGSLYNFSDNYFKLLIQQTACELFTLSVTISNSSTRKDLSNITENLVLRMMHKLLSGLRKDHQVIFMFIFCVKLLQNDSSELKEVKNLIIDKVSFLFSGLQIYYGDLLAMKYELKDFNRDPKWDYTKHKLQDVYNTIEGKILPIVNHFDISKAQTLLKTQNLGLDNLDQKPKDYISLTSNIESYQSFSPELKQQNSNNIEAGAQKIVKRIGGHIYRAFQVESLIKNEKKQKIYRDDITQLNSPLSGKRRVSVLEGTGFKLNPLQSDDDNKLQNQIETNLKPSMRGKFNSKDSIRGSGDQNNNQKQETRALIIRKETNIGEMPTMVSGFKRRSTITEGMSQARGQPNQLRALLPHYHFEGLTTLISKFMDTFKDLESEIVMNKEQWLQMFFSTPATQDFDPFDMVPKINQRKQGRTQGANDQDHQVIDQLLLLFISKSEVVSKAIDQMIKHILDPIFHYLPKHMIEVHATLEWFKRPTILFYTSGSPNPVQRIINSAKKAFRQTLRISCGKSNFEILKSKILHAARRGNWLIIENLQMLPEDQILRILKFIYDRIVYVRQSFLNLRIWFTYFVEGFNSEEYTPLDLPSSVSTKLFVVTNDCFKIFVNKKQGIKEQLMDVYEQNIGYVLHEFEEHFYSVLLPKETVNEKESIFQTYGSTWDKIFMENLNRHRRKDLLIDNKLASQNLAKVRFQKRFITMQTQEVQQSFKIFALISIFLERSQYLKDNFGEFQGDHSIQVQVEDFKQFSDQLWFFLYFANRKQRQSNQLLYEQVIAYLSCLNQGFIDLQSTNLASIIRFFRRKVKEQAISAGRKNCYYFYGKLGSNSVLNLLPGAQSLQMHSHTLPIQALQASQQLSNQEQTSLQHQTSQKLQIPLGQVGSNLPQNNGNNAVNALIENIERQQRNLKLLTNQDFRKNLNLMPEKDQLAILGVTQNQGLVRWYKETKDILKGLSLHFGRYNINQHQENRLSLLFELNRDQITKENRDLLLNGFRREMDTLNQKQLVYSQKIRQKEDYCFGDIDKIVELYLTTFDQKNQDEIGAFESKLIQLLKTAPSAQRYNLYKEKQAIVTANSVSQKIVEFFPEPALMNQQQKGFAQNLAVDFIKENISDIQKAGTPLTASRLNRPYMNKAAGVGSGQTVEPHELQKIKSDQLKANLRNELELLRKLYYDSVQSRELQMERVYNIINYVNDLLPKPLEMPEFKIKLQPPTASQNLPEEQSADEEEVYLLRELTGLTLKKNESAQPKPQQSLRDGRRPSFITSGLSINTQVRKLEVGPRRPSIKSPHLLYSYSHKDEPLRNNSQHSHSNQLAPISNSRQMQQTSGGDQSNEQRERGSDIDSPASPNVIRMRKFTLGGGTLDQSIPMASGKPVTQALSQFDYQYKYRNFSHKNEQVLKNFFTAEILLMNKVIQRLQRDLNALKNYIQGFRIQSLDLYDLDLYESLLNNKVPGPWLKNGFFCKITITLVDWLELLTSKYAYLERWAIECRGQPPPVLKLTVLMNPVNLLHQMLADYSNLHGIYFNCLGFAMYFPRNKPNQQYLKGGLYLEGIIIRNGHINLETGELEEAMVREFEQELPLFKLRVQALRSSKLDTADSIPLFIRAPQSQKLPRYYQSAMKEQQFVAQGQNHARSLLTMIDSMQEEIKERQPLEPASPAKFVKFGKTLRIREAISVMANKQENQKKQENYVQVQIQKQFATPANMIQSPLMRNGSRAGGLLAVASTSIGNIGGKKIKIQNQAAVVPQQSKKKNGQILRSNFSKNQNSNNSNANSGSGSNIGGANGGQGQQRVGEGGNSTRHGGKGLIQLFEIESQSSNDSQDPAQKNRSHSSNRSDLELKEKGLKLADKKRKPSLAGTKKEQKANQRKSSSIEDQAQARIKNQEDQYEKSLDSTFKCILEERKFIERGFETERQIRRNLRQQRKEKNLGLSSGDEDSYSGADGADESDEGTYAFKLNQIQISQTPRNKQLNIQLSPMPHREDGQRFGQGSPGSQRHSSNKKSLFSFNHATSQGAYHQRQSSGNLIVETKNNLATLETGAQRFKQSSNSSHSLSVFEKANHLSIPNEGVLRSQEFDRQGEIGLPRTISIGSGKEGQDSISIDIPQVRGDDRRGSSLSSQRNLDLAMIDTKLLNSQISGIKVEEFKNKPKEGTKLELDVKTVKMFDQIPEESDLRYDVICPLIGQIESSNQFKLKFHFRFKSRLPQSYWNSAGLIAYFSNIKTI